MPSDQAAVPAVPTAFPREVMQRIDPSPEVQQQVASAIEACTKWRPQVVQVAKADAMPAQSTTAQVCDVLDRWPLLYGGQVLKAASVGVGLAIAAALACTAIGASFLWAVRQAVRIMRLGPPTGLLIGRAVGGALCGVGLATAFLLLTLPVFAAVTAAETVDKAFLFWTRTAPWAAAVFAVLFVLAAVPDAWRYRASPAATR